MSMDATAGMNASWATQPRDPASLAAQQVTNAQEFRSERGGPVEAARTAADTAPARETSASREAPPPRASEPPARSAPAPGQGGNVDILV